MTSTASSVPPRPARRLSTALAGAARGVLAIPRSYVVLGAAFVAARIVMVAGAPPEWTTDTWQYAHQAHESLFTKMFYADVRGFTLPLLYKLVSGNHLRMTVQVAIGIVCWLWLAAAVARSVRDRRVSVAGFALVLLFGSTLWIGMWDAHLLTESLSISLAVALIAAWLELVRRPAWPMVAALLALALLWANVRNSNAPLLLFALPIPLIWLIRSSLRRLAAACLLGLVLVTAFSLEADQRARRWADELTHIVERRIIPDRSARAFFVRHGMPLSPQVAAHARVGTWAAVIRIAKVPGGPRWIHWVEYGGGESTYRQWLAAHPAGAASLVWRRRDAELAVNQSASAISPTLASYRPPGVRQVLPGPVQDVVYPPGATWTQVYALLLIPLLFLALGRGRSRRAATVPLALLLLTIPHAAIVVLGDAAEISRHALLVGLLLRLAFVFGLVFAVDAYLVERAAAGRVPRIPPSRGGWRPHLPRRVTGLGSRVSRFGTPGRAARGGSSQAGSSCGQLAYWPAVVRARAMSAGRA